MGSTRSKNTSAVAGLTPIIILLVAAATTTPAAPSSSAAGTPSYKPHVPIFIDGDAGFTTANGVTGGDGTASNPYKIDGWEINATSQDGIFIRNTRAYFVVHNVYIHSAVQNHNGTVLVSVSNGRLANSTYFNNRYGIRLASTSNIVITENNVTANEIGMFLSGYNTIITDNEFSGNVDGLRLGAAFNGLVADNQFSSNTHYGINLDYSHNITVNRNTFTGNGVSIYGSSLSYLNSHTITPDNLVNGKPILYYKDCSGVTADGVTAGQLIFVNCANIRVASLRINFTDIGLQLLNVQNATIASNQISWAKIDGIRVQSSKNITITGNSVFKNGMYSLDIFTANNITVTRNLFTLNSFGGLFLFNSNNITLAHNTISSNTWYGTSLTGSTGIHTYHNNFQNNRYQASDNRAGENSWDNGHPSGGNYWSDYTGPDNCGGVGQNVCTGPDGIGDTPYIIDADSRDNYPLTQPAKTRDVAVTDIVVSPSFAVQGQAVSISVSTSNLGDAPENFTITVYANETIIGSQTVQNQTPGTLRTTTFTWNTTSATPGTYTVRATAGPVPGETNIQDNAMAVEATISGVVPFLSLAHREAADGSSIDLTAAFPDTCFETTSWGTPVRNGNSFTVQLGILDFHGGTVECIPKNIRDNYTYALGPLENGAYVFKAILCLQVPQTPESFCGSGATLYFTVQNIPPAQPGTEPPGTEPVPSFWQQNWPLILSAAFGAASLSTALLMAVRKQHPEEATR